jgi:RNA polymerase sigma-70 factor (ECF subfamily)
LEPQDATEQFYALVWPHAADVLRLAKILCGNDSDAQDLSQETLLKAFAALDRFDGENVRGWLYAILRNCRTDRARARQRQPITVPLDEMTGQLIGLAGETGVDESNDPDTILEGFSDQQVIVALKSLPEEIQWTLLLVDVQGLDQAEAARILEVPVGTIKSRAHRGRAMLAGLLKSK